MSARLVVVIVALLQSACDGSDGRLPEYELAGQSMGTTYSVKLVLPPDTVDRSALGVAIADKLGMIEERLSTYIADSELARFNASESTDWITVSDELCRLVDAALAISERTGGAFDVTVGPLVNLWGFGPAGTRAEPPGDEEVADLLSLVGHDKLHADCGVPAIRKDSPHVYVDLSGYAKGYAVDEVAKLLDESGLDNYLVEVGGELRASGHNASRERWAIAIEKPVDNSRSVQSVLRVTDCAVATSGDYRNYFEYHGRRFSHTIDPETGRPVSHAAAAVTVVRDSAAEADALATALLVLGPEEGLQLAAREGIAAYFLLRTANGIEERSTDEFVAQTN